MDADDPTVPGQHFPGVFDRHRASGVEDDVESSLESGRVEVELDDGIDLQFAGLTFRADATATCHGRAAGGRELHRRAADSPETAVHEHRFARLQLPLCEQRLIGSDADYRDGGRSLERQSCGFLDDALLLCDDRLGERARPLDGRRTENVVTHADTSDILADGLDDAGEVVTHSSWEAATGHHFHCAVADSEVHRVGCCRPHPDENIVRAEFLRLELFEPHDFRAAVPVVLNSFHRGHMRSLIKGVGIHRGRVSAKTVKV